MAEATIPAALKTQKGFVYPQVLKDELLQTYERHRKTLFDASKELLHPEFFPWDLADDLLEKPLAISSTRELDPKCENFSERENVWISILANAYSSDDAPLLNRVAQLCRGAQIRHCQNSDCSKEREILDKFAPPCQWQRFREWAIALIACQACSTHNQRLTMLHTHLVAAVLGLHVTLLEYCESGISEKKPLSELLLGTTEHRVELLGIYDVIYWIHIIQFHMGFSLTLLGKVGANFVPSKVSQSAAKSAREVATKMGICQYRLQKLMDVAERKEADLPAFMETVKKYPSLSHCKRGPGTPDFDSDLYHGNCTPDYCPPNKADTTLKEQVHKCHQTERSECRDVQYHVDDLEKSIQELGVSTWSIYDRRPAAPDEKFVALSHVWIDGTGIGNGPDPTKRENMGIVHDGLDKFWRDIVERLGCTAYWWDTISLPTSPAIRRREINGMHWKYAAATHVVIHDNYLLNFDWSEDGSPCVALVLGSWFTRGWTSLELHAAKSVKVLWAPIL
ncbi:hypothetical protein ABW20_dc0108451 [Dactylellina cionopaga]|nr:hypothetical protein ABW20_dc0108451 [Dactylellina cionopaga]